MNSKKIKIKNIDESLIVDEDKYDIVNSYTWRFSPLGLFITNVWIETKRTVLTFQKVIFPDFYNQHVYHKNGNILDWRKKNILSTKDIDKELRKELREQKKQQIQLFSSNINKMGM